MKIGLFDSGIGGLTVLKKMLEKYPNNEYIYYGDTLNNPYGNKTKEELIKLSTKIIDFLISRGAELIIIACGTVSSNIYNNLKDMYNIPIIDVITPTINYLNNSEYKKIGVLATQATINSKIFSKNIKKDIIEIPCPMLVPLIENNDINSLDKHLKIYLNELTDRDIVVLGCTHYPIIKDRINKYLNTKLLDMSECIEVNIKNDSNKKVNLYFSRLNDNISNNIENILKGEIVCKYELIL